MEKMTATTIIILVFIGLSAGMLSGMIGVGGGIIMVPMLVLLGFSQHSAQGVSLAAMLPPVTFFAVYNYYKEGYVDWRYAVIISLLFVVGGYLGSKIAISIDQKILRRIFGVILIVVAGKMIFGK
jgi:uncharacterized membrane protein YfcA